MGVFFVADMDNIAPRKCATPPPNFPPNPGPVAEGVVAGFGQLATDAVPVAYNGPAPTGGSGPTNYSVGSGDLFDHPATYQQGPYPTGQVRPVIEGVTYGSGEVPILHIQKFPVAPPPPQPTPTSTAFTINGSSGLVTTFIFNTIDLKAIVSFLGGAQKPVNPGEQVQFWAQQTSFPAGSPFQFDMAALSAGAPYTAEDPAYAFSGQFTAGSTYNVWAVYPGDTLNTTSTSNTVALHLQSS